MGNYVDPYAAERALAEWAQARGLAYSPTPDARWYQAWAPFSYLGPIARVGREVRANIGDAVCGIVETREGDPIKEATGEDRRVVAFLVSQRLRYRAAVRSRTGGGIASDVSRHVDEVSRDLGLEGLFGTKKPAPQGMLGDPTFDSLFEVAAPSMDEARAALPPALRHLLVQGAFRGILELRAGGLVVTFFDRPAFEPQTLEGSLARVAQIYQALG
jgi:hypothetical protein